MANIKVYMIYATEWTLNQLPTKKFIQAHLTVLENQGISIHVYICLLLKLQQAKQRTEKKALAQ